METPKFLQLVADMRKAQKDFFEFNKKLAGKAKTPHDWERRNELLDRSVAIEKQIDAAILENHFTVEVKADEVEFQMEQDFTLVITVEDHSNQRSLF